MTMARYDVERVDVAPCADARSHPFPLGAAFVALFITTSATGIDRHVPLNYVVKGAGGLLALMYLIRAVRADLRLNREVVLFFAWLAWSVTGLPVARSTAVFWDKFGTIVQMGILLLILTGFTYERRLLTLNLVALLGGVLIAVGFSIATGEFRRAELEGYRAGSIYGTNSFGHAMVMTTAILAYLWMHPGRGRLVRKGLVGAGMVAAAMATVLSGSRKSVLGIGLFYPVWLAFCYGRLLFRRPVVLLVMVLTVAVGLYFFGVYVGQSAAGERLEETWQYVRGERPSGSTGYRVQLYKDAFKVFREHPVLGVGLRNFQLLTRTKRHYTHSDIMAVLTGTGLPGLLIYGSLYVVLWRRTRRIIREAPDPADRDTARLIRVTIIVIGIMGLGLSLYDRKEHWLLFGPYIGWAATMWRELNWRATGELPAQPGAV
jgi:O-antigen ligase